MLTARKRAFIDYYKSTGVATEAARLSGYKAKHLNRIGSRLLHDVDIKAQIEEFENERKANLSREHFVKTAWEEFKQAPLNSPQRPRFLEIAGKALGYMNNEEVNTNKDIHIEIHNTIGILSGQGADKP